MCSFYSEVARLTGFVGDNINHKKQKKIKLLLEDVT